MKVFFRYGRGLFFLLYFLLIFSCEEEFEPYYNKEAHPPVIEPIPLEGLTEGRHITGSFHFDYTPTIPADKILYAEFLVDDEVVMDYYSAPPYVIILDTKSWPEGEHSITIGIYEKNPPDLGLLAIAGVPSFIYSVNVYFDHTPPTPVVLESVVWNEESNAPVVTWQKNNDPNFYAYIVQWEINGGYHDSGLIYDQNVTSFTSPDMSPGSIGYVANYRVWTYNNDQSVMSNEIAFSYPESFPTTIGTSAAERAILSPDGTELYTLTNYVGIQVTSLIDYSIKRTYPIASESHDFTLSKDGSRLYVMVGSFILILNSSTFEVIKEVNFVGFEGSKIICGRSDRLYVSTIYPYSGPLKILDANTLEEVGSLDMKAPGGLLAISSDNNTLYVAAQNPDDNYQSANVFAVDISTDEPSIINQREASDQVRDMELSSDNATLYVIHDFNYPAEMNQYVDSWHTSTLLSYNQLSVPSQAFNMNVSGQTLCVVYGNRHLNHWEAGGIMQYNLTTGLLEKNWDFMRAPYGCFTDTGNQKIYVFGERTWIIPLTN